MIEKKSTHRFPAESGDGEIRLEGNIIICEGVQSSLCREVDIDHMQYVYIVVDAKGKSSLFIFGHHQNFLPTNIKGFQEVYCQLSEKFGFNDQVFFEHVHSTERVKKEIWRKKEAPNFRILPTGSFQDYEQGFEIQSPGKEFVSWDTTFEALGKNISTYFDTSPYGQKILKFKYPVRLGNLILHDLTAYFNSERPDGPVLCFYADCFDESNSGSSYFALRNLLKKDIGEEHHCLNYERDDQKSFNFRLAGMQISLVYTHDSQWQFDGGYTSFRVENKREYPALLENPVYEGIMEVSDYVLLNYQVQLVGEYKRDKRIKRRPEKLAKLHPHFPIVWMDLKNGKIGFADQSYAVLHPISSIEHFGILNILPAKGPGGAYLTIYFRDGGNYSVMSGKCRAFNFYNEKLAKLSGKEIKMEPEFHDC